MCRLAHFKKQATYISWDTYLWGFLHSFLNDKNVTQPQQPRVIQFHAPFQSFTLPSHNEMVKKWSQNAILCMGYSTLSIAFTTNSKCSGKDQVMLFFYETASETPQHQEWSEACKRKLVFNERKLSMIPSFPGHHCLHMPASGCWNRLLTIQLLLIITGRRANRKDSFRLRNEWRDAEGEGNSSRWPSPSLSWEVG